jgi:hypothetical protein
MVLMGAFASENVLSADNQQERLQKIDPWYISGFVDGEGTFHVSFARRKDLPRKWAIIPEFHISQHQDRASVLDEIQTFFGCGVIRENHRGRINDVTRVLVVRNRRDLLDKIIPFFRQYHLRSQKRDDFRIFAEIVEAMERGSHYSSEGFYSIVKLAFGMNGGGRYRKRKIEEFSEESPETVRQTPFGEDTVRSA